MMRPWKIWRCRRLIFQTFVSMDHFASDASVSGRVLRGLEPDSTRT